MDLIYNNRGTVYSYSRDATSKISGYSEIKNIDVNIQPLGTKDGFSSSRVYKTSRIYTKEGSINVGDKILIDNIAYIVDTKEKRDSPEITYFKYIVSESEGV